MLKYYLHKVFHNFLLVVLTFIMALFTAIMLDMGGAELNGFIKIMYAFIILTFDTTVVLLAVELDEILTNQEKQMRYN